MRRRPTTTPRLRAAIARRIERFGMGRMEIHSAVLEALVRDVESLERERDEALKHVRESADTLIGAIKARDRDAAPSARHCCGRCDRCPLAGRRP